MISKVIVALAWFASKEKQTPEFSVCQINFLKNFFADCGIENPWLVDSLFQFQFFCCPECEEKVSEIQEFIKHAISKHPKVRCFKENFYISHHLTCFIKIFVKNLLKAGNFSMSFRILYFIV